MKKALCVLGLLAFVAVASADIDLFITQQGTTNLTTYMGTTAAVGFRFNQNATKFTLAAGATTSPGTLSHGPFDLGAASVATPVTATFYVWAKFSNIPMFDTDADEVPDTPGYIQVYGLGLQGSTLSGAATLPQSATYRQVIAADGIQRWGNTDPLPFPYGPATTGSGTSAGMVAPKTADTLQKTFGETDVYYSLIGAFQYTATGTSQMTFGVGNPLPFIAVRYLDPDAAVVADWDTKSAESFYPYLTVMGQPYTYGAGTQPIVAITTTPEPASLVLLGLAGLLIRRR